MRDRQTWKTHDILGLTALALSLMLLLSFPASGSPQSDVPQTMPQTGGLEVREAEGSPEPVLQELQGAIGVNQAPKSGSSLQRSQTNQQLQPNAGSDSFQQTRDSE